MAKTWKTRDGDMVDLIAFETLGDEDARTAIHDANPTLADHGLILPSGLIIVIPEWEKPEENNVVSGGVAG